MRPTSLLAVAVSAVVGVGCGVGGGLLTDIGGKGHQDPLAIGVPLVNRSCNGESLLVVAIGNAAPPLAAAVAEDPHLSYLDTSQSCHTAWTQHGATERYAAYLGPFASPAQACSLRMTEAHRGDFVTRLHDGNQDPVSCVCYRAYSAMPILRPGMDVGIVDGIWIRALQRVLTDLGYLAGGHVSGFYDLATIDAVKQFKHQEGIPLPFNGVVESATWHALVSKGCRLYDS